MAADRSSRACDHRLHGCNRPLQARPTRSPLREHDRRRYGPSLRLPAQTGPHRTAAFLENAGTTAGPFRQTCRCAVAGHQADAGSGLVQVLDVVTHHRTRRLRRGRAARAHELSRGSDDAPRVPACPPPELSQAESEHAMEEAHNDPSGRVSVQPSPIANPSISADLLRGCHRRRLRSAISVCPPLRLWGFSASRLVGRATKAGKSRPQRAIGTRTHDPRRTSSRQMRVFSMRSATHSYTACRPAR